MCLFVMAVLGFTVGFFLSAYIKSLSKKNRLEANTRCAQLINLNSQYQISMPIFLLSYEYLKRHHYLFVEICSAFLSVALLAYFGLGVQFFSSLLFCWVLLVLFYVDLQIQILPDQITQPLIWGGLLVNFFGVFVSLNQAVMGAVSGYLFFFGIGWLFKRLTHKEGLGHGDFKLLAACGAWMGWMVLPLLVCLACLISLSFIALSYCAKRYQWGQKMPFGPGLVIAALIILFFGKVLMADF